MIRRSPRWPLALALLLSAAPSALAQTPAMVPDVPPPPPAAPPPPMPSAPKVTAPAPAPVGVAATVNGVKIYRYQVANEAMKMVGPQLVNQMILIELINQTAKKQGVSVTPAQVDARLNQLKEQYAQRVPGGLDSLLAQRHQTLANYKQQLRTEILVENLVGKTLPPVAPTTRFHARHLLILSASPNSPAGPDAKSHTDAEALALIAKAQADLKAGKSFEEVANTYTEDPSGKGKGGDLGLIDAKTAFDPNFLKAALALKPGEVTPEPVKSVYGYHLIKIDSSSAAPLPADKKLYDDAAEADRRQQIQQAIPPYVEKLRSQASIVNYLPDPAAPAGPFSAPPAGMRPRPPAPRPAPPVKPAPVTPAP